MLCLGIGNTKEIVLTFGETKARLLISRGRCIKIDAPREVQVSRVPKKQKTSEEPKK